MQPETPRFINTYQSMYEHRRASRCALVGKFLGVRAIRGLAQCQPHMQHVLDDSSDHETGRCAKNLQS